MSMENIRVDFGSSPGSVKPMHAVNNGPNHKLHANDQLISNLEAYKAAGIPYARNHDASFHGTYGGEHTVDVHRIFKDFSKDPYDPANYNFIDTDNYLQVIELAGTKCFYRLGARIEHTITKCGTLPPPDFHKWAVICEHIIRHYTEGWANGFHMDIKYWEIWNEPDLDTDDSAHKRTWGGTQAEFFEFYDVAARHLKKCFPHLKIGGPALAGSWEWADDFLKQVTAPMDFFSWHNYSNDPHRLADCIIHFREALDQYGFKNTESILNEWNYVQGWAGEEFAYTVRSIRGIKGASYTAAAMCMGQHLPVDMLMYYDARPGAFNCLFDALIPSQILKGYYTFKMFNELYKLSTAADISQTNDIYTAAARNGQKAAILLTHYNNDDATAPQTVKVDMQGLHGENGVRARYYLLDQNHSMELVKEEIFSGDAFSTVIHMKLFDTLLIKLDVL